MKMKTINSKKISKTNMFKCKIKGLFCSLIQWFSNFWMRKYNFQILCTNTFKTEVRMNLNYENENY